MKRVGNLLGLGLLVILFSTSCDEVLDQLNITFETGPHTVEFAIDSANQGAVVSSFDVVFHDLKTEVENYGGDFEKLDLVKLKKATISIKSGADNFNAIESFELSIKTPLLADKKIAWINSIPADVTEVTPTLTGDNLKAFMVEGEYTITLKSVLKSDVTKTIDLKADIFFDINL